MNESVTLRVYTIGHSSHPLERFLDLLRLASIEVLVDTRSLPHSKFVPHFNHDALKHSLLSAGFQYLYLGRELGGRPDDDQLYDASGHVLYDRVASSTRFKKGLARLLAGMQAYRVALLCAEENPRRCHRRLLITRELRKLHLEVDHIRGDGRLESERDLEAEELGSRPQLALFLEAGERA